MEEKYSFTFHFQRPRHEFDGEDEDDVLTPGRTRCRGRRLRLRCHAAWGCRFLLGYDDDAATARHSSWAFDILSLS